MSKRAHLFLASKSDLKLEGFSQDDHRLKQLNVNCNKSNQMSFSSLHIKNVVPVEIYLPYLSQVTVTVPTTVSSK